VIEDHEGGVQLLGSAHDFADLSRAGVELRIGPAAAAAHDVVTHHPGAFDQAHHLGDALFVGGVAEIEADDDRRAGVGGLGAAFQTRLLFPCRRPG
jgi:hypothetical protein